MHSGDETIKTLMQLPTVKIISILASQVGGFVNNALQWYILTVSCMQGNLEL